MSEISMVGVVKGYPKRSIAKNGVPLCTLDIAMPKAWVDDNGDLHRGRDYIYRVRYSGELAKTAAGHESGTRVLVTGRIDGKNYMKNWEREKKYWAYILGTTLKEKKKAVVL